MDEKGVDEKAMNKQGVEEKAPTSQQQTLNKKSLTVIAVIFLAGIAAVAVIFNTEPEAKREAATKRSAMLVDVEPAKAGSYQPTIIAMGNVRPAQHIVLRSRVSSEVTTRSDKFVPGKLIEKGEELLQLDDADYRNTLAQSQSDLQQAEAALELEMGEQAAAEADYRRLNRKFNKMQESLLLREPQLNMAKADLASAKAALAQAQLDVDRTKITAPFNAQIITRHVNIGSQVSVGDPLAELIGIETYWVEATVPTSKLKWLEDAASASTVKIYDRNAWQKDEFRTGKLHSIIAELDQQTRMAKILIEVNDPLALQQANSADPTLIAGAYVECELNAKTLDNVVRMPREYLRKNNTVWIMQDNGRLNVRSPDIIFRDAEYVYIGSGITEGERIVTSSLSNVSEGAELRIAEASTGAQ